tara:strand:- start:331 stop:543 length:213 start_codon:yes stop_codon:yes gene_type:complete
MLAYHALISDNDFLNQRSVNIVRLTKQQIIEQEQDMEVWLKEREDADQVAPEQQDADADWEARTCGDFYE